MKVFLHFSGSYSDRTCMGVYTTASISEAAKDLFLPDDIEEWEADQIPSVPENLRPWKIYMTAEGRARAERQAIQTDGEIKVGITATPSGVPDQMVIELWARDEQHAIKSANERRIVMLAENTWETDWDTVLWKGRHDFKGAPAPVRIFIQPNGEAQVWEQSGGLKKIKACYCGWEFVDHTDVKAIAAAGIAKATSWCEKNHCTILEILTP